jgi:hypothetical protein
VAARDAARAWRRTILAQAGVPDSDRRRVVLKPRTPYSRVCVHLRPARRGASAYWTATFTKADGTRRQRVWSIRQYGHEQAFALGIAQREAWEVAELGSALPKPGPAPVSARVFAKADAALSAAAVAEAWELLLDSTLPQKTRMAAAWNSARAARHSGGDAAFTRAKNVVLALAPQEESDGMAAEVGRLWAVGREPAAVQVRRTA